MSEVTVFRCSRCRYAARTLAMLDAHMEQTHGEIEDVAPEEVAWPPPLDSGSAIPYPGARKEE